jgi:hypothetical protein
MPAAANSPLMALVETPELAALGPGPRASRMPISDINRALGEIFQLTNLAPQRQSLARALVLLWNDYLDAAHTLAQDIPTSDGSYIHGIMHRREPDYGNAKYWFHRTGRHAVLPTLAERAHTLAATDAEGALVKKCIAGGAWDPFAFVDCCQDEEQSPTGQQMFLRRLQQAEFSLLLRHLAAL